MRIVRDWSVLKILHFMTLTLSVFFNLFFKLSSIFIKCLSNFRVDLWTQKASQNVTLKIYEKALSEVCHFSAFEYYAVTNWVQLCMMKHKKKGSPCFRRHQQFSGGFRYVRFFYFFLALIKNSLIDSDAINFKWERLPFSGFS